MKNTSNSQNGLEKVEYNWKIYTTSFHSLQWSYRCCGIGISIEKQISGAEQRVQSSTDFSIKIPKQFSGKWKTFQKMVPKQVDIHIEKSQPWLIYNNTYKQFKMNHDLNVIAKTVKSNWWQVTQSWPEGKWRILRQNKTITPQKIINCTSSIKETSDYQKAPLRKLVGKPYVGNIHLTTDIFRIYFKNLLQPKS